MFKNLLYYLNGSSTNSFILNVLLQQIHIKYLMETALTSYLTTSLDHSVSSEAHTCSAIQKILHYLWNIRFNYHIRKDLVLSQMTPSQILQSCIFNNLFNPVSLTICFNISFSSVLMSSKWWEIYLYILKANQLYIPAHYTTGVVCQTCEISEKKVDEL